MSRPMSKGINLMGALPPTGTKPIFPVLGPREREYSTINLKPKLHSFHGLFRVSYLMGLEWIWNHHIETIDKKNCCQNVAWFLKLFYSPLWHCSQIWVSRLVDGWLPTHLRDEISANHCSCYVYCSYKMFSVHLILSLSISYPYLVKFHYFVDNSQEEGVKHHHMRVTQVQEGHDFMDNSSMFQKVPKIPNFFGSRYHKIYHQKKKGNIDNHHGQSIPNLNS
jgi:hypothetical protein